MNNNQMPGMGGAPQPMPQPIQPIQPAGSQPMGASPMQPAGVNGMPMVQQVQAPVEPKKDIAGLVKTIVIIALSLVAVTFIGLFVWMMMQYNEAREDVDGQIAVAVAEAKDEQAAELEKEFLEREKNPYKTFKGPADYGELTFEYPKTWSVYVAEAATAGGDFNAYFNPIQVDAINKENPEALRLTIRDKLFDEVAQEYQKAMEKKGSDLAMTSETIGKNSNITANRYTGTIPNTELSGYIVIFKIRDKTAVLQTDSAQYFGEEFNKLLGTVTFNE